MNLSHQHYQGFLYDSIRENREFFRGDRDLPDSLSGYKYLGHMKDKLKHGFGKIWFTNGTKFAGEFDNDLK